MALRSKKFLRKTPRGWMCGAFFLLCGTALAQGGLGSAPCAPLPSVGQCTSDGSGSCPNLNGFLPFGSSNLWNTCVGVDCGTTAPIDPQNALYHTLSGVIGNTHHDFGFNGDAGMPFEVVDSSTQPLIPITVGVYASSSDVVVAPIPTNVPIEGGNIPLNCPGNPPCSASGGSGNCSDSHTLTLDRHTCNLYETFFTQNCSGVINAVQMTVWNATNGSGNNLQARPFGWTSADASGSSLYVGIIKYDEEAACVAAGAPYKNVPHHAIRYTMAQTANDGNGGQLLPPATHAAGSNFNQGNVIGMRIRLQESYDVTGKSPINQCILNQMKQYGMILADNGGNLYFQGAPDVRWDPSDLNNLDGINISNFDLIQGAAPLPGYDMPGGIFASANASYYAAPTPPPATLSATGTTGGTSIVVPSAAGIAVGQWVQDLSNYPVHLLYGTQVTSVSGTTIGLSTALAGPISGNVAFGGYPGCYPGYTTAIIPYNSGGINCNPNGSAPAIGSFSVSSTSVASGSPVTFTWSISSTGASADTYDFIDNAGILPGVGSGSLTIHPTATTTYKLNSLNLYGQTQSSGITVTVTGGAPAVPTGLNRGRGPHR